MTNIFFLPSLPASILCNYLFIFLMCIFPTASLFFTSYFLQQSIFLQLVPCFFILLPSVSRYSLFCREVFFMSDPYPSFLKILLTTVLPLKYFLLLTIFPSAPDHLPVIYVLATYCTCKFSFWIFPLHKYPPPKLFPIKTVSVTSIPVNSSHPPITPSRDYFSCRCISLQQMDS